MKRRKIRRKRRFQPLPPKFIIISAEKFGWYLTVLSVILVIALVYFSGIFKIKKILCLQGEKPCSSQVEAELNGFLNQNILKFRADQVASKLKSADIAVDEVKVKVKLPHTLSVQLQPRASLTSLSIATGSAIIFVDSNLIPFKVSQTAKQPAEIISSRAKDLRLGEQIMDPILSSAIKLSLTLKDYFVSFDQIQTQNDRLQVVLKNKTLAIFPIEPSFEKTVPSLQLILRTDTIQAKPKVIDLRFNKPVLRF